MFNTITQMYFKKSPTVPLDADIVFSCNKSDVSFLIITRRPTVVLRQRYINSISMIALHPLSSDLTIDQLKESVIIIQILLLGFYF